MTYILNTNNNLKNHDEIVRRRSRTSVNAIFISHYPEKILVIFRNYLICEMLLKIPKIALSDANFICWPTTHINKHCDDFEPYMVYY